MRTCQGHQQTSASRWAKLAHKKLKLAKEEIEKLVTYIRLSGNSLCNQKPHPAMMLNEINKKKKEKMDEDTLSSTMKSAMQLFINAIDKMAITSTSPMLPQATTHPLLPHNYRENLH